MKDLVKTSPRPSPPKALRNDVAFLYTHYYIVLLTHSFRVLVEVGERRASF